MQQNTHSKFKTYLQFRWRTHRTAQAHNAAAQGRHRKTHIFQMVFEDATSSTFDIITAASIDVMCTLHSIYHHISYYDASEWVRVFDVRVCAREIYPHTFHLFEYLIVEPKNWKMKIEYKLERCVGVPRTRISLTRNLFATSNANVLSSYIATVELQSNWRLLIMRECELRKHWIFYWFIGWFGLVRKLCITYSYAPVRCMHDALSKIIAINLLSKWNDWVFTCIP